MATTKKPVVHDDTNNVLTPLADGQVLEPSAIPVSDVDGNVVTVESDGLAVTAENLVSKDTGNRLIVQDGKLMVESESGDITVVSADADNLIRAGSDGGAYVDGNDLLSNGDVNLLTINETDKKIILTKEQVMTEVASELVDGGDLILKAEDGKIVAELCINYEPLTGALTLTGVDGKDVCEVTIPGQASVLKSVEFVTTKPDAGGTATTGTYPVTVQLRDSVAGWIDPVTVNIETTRGTATAVTIEIDAGTTCGGLPSGVVNARAWFVGQESSIYAGTSTMGFVFADGSVLNITSYSLNASGTGYTLTGTFTPTIGIATGAWLHFIFELTDYSVCELYVDVAYLIDVYTAGSSIDITNKVISVKLVSGGGLYDIGNGLAVNFSEMDPSILQGIVLAMVQEGGGLSVDENGQLYVDFDTMPTDKFETLLKSLRVPIWLTANKSFYVNGTTGSDDTSIEGIGESADNPFKTIQACVTYVTDNYNVSSYTCTIYIAPGTYEESVTLPDYNRTTGYIVLRGQDSDNPPVIQSSSGTVLYGSQGGTWHIRYLIIKRFCKQSETSSSTSYASAIIFTNSSILYMYSCQVYGEIQDVESPLNNLYLRLISVRSNAILYIQSGSSGLEQKLTIVNNATSSNAYASNFFLLESQGLVFTEGGAETARYWYCEGDVTNFLSISGSSWWTQGGYTYNVLFVETGSGVTGRRYAAYYGSGINTRNAGSDYFPGDTAGTVDSATYCWYN